MLIERNMSVQYRKLMNGLRRHHMFMVVLELYSFWPGSVYVFSTKPYIIHIFL